MTEVVPGVSAFSEYSREYLRIVDKHSRLVPLDPNPAQTMLLDIIDKRVAEGKPVRIIILKARQLGFSTISLAKMYETTTTNTGMHSFFAAHDDESTKDLFGRVRLMYDQAPDKPMTRYSNRTELDFSNPDPKMRQVEPGLLSKITVGTAGKSTLGRSKTLRFLHCSEVAFWRDAKRVLLGLEQALPALPGTVEIIESTANGVGNEFHMRWQRANDVDTRGDWIPLFVAWFHDPEYRKPLADGEMEPIPSCVEDREAFLREEAEIKALNALDDEQMNWRRWAIVNLAANRIEDFHQEYPTTPEEAFLTSGRPVFNQPRIQFRKRQLQAHDLEAKHGKKKQRYVVGNLVENRGKIKFSRNPNGFLHVYRFPEKAHLYTIGADVAEGITKGDNPDRSAAQVFDHSTMEQVAVWDGRKPVHEFAKDLELLGYYYNTARLAPEANNHGHSVCMKLEMRRYPNLYLREDTEKLGGDVIKRSGFLTNMRTRPLIIDAIDQGVNENVLRLNHIPTLDQMLTFVRTEKGKAEGDEGCHDDLVLALGIVAWIITQARYKPTPAHSEWKPKPKNDDAEMVRRNLEKWKKDYLASRSYG